ncbi:GNAT family N-acetyltransferase [candidate division KSB1 bacterium]|nr:GNAT family N-acetyltransferase [candidate division KSB1 bacterium]
MIIRQPELADATALMQFYNRLSVESKRTFRPLGEKTTLEACQAIIDKNNMTNFVNYDLVACVNERIVGWSFIWGIDSETPVFGLGIADDYQGKGLGSRLMDDILIVARQLRLKKVYLTVVTDNLIAVKMYEKRGFVRYDESLEDDGLMYYKMVAEI